ncbi:hypothetical protein JIQ42_05140 [Leishmania sp. Namibia]|uniref:hypothetical protein n=1 Tax=Leishmania sp. Namibia TaxID=2802991 RepID=UPI001B40FAAF|nr:hypothetical protein JIQ42_05140 [Leishmania sp. Namibia]
MANSVNGSRKSLLAPTVTMTEGDVGATLYLTAQRWRSYLLEHSVAFRQLQEERERGWRSVALDEWYARRQAKSAPSLPTDATVTNSSRSTPELVVRREAEKGDGTTAFVTVDVALLAERYRQHARRITQHAASDFFTPVRKAASPSSSDAAMHPVSPAPLFLDLGCAPGGVSKYLVQDLGWRGVGVTLASADGGIEMDPLLLHESPWRAASFVLLDGDITQPPSTWSLSASYAPVDGKNCSTSSSAQSPPRAPSTVFTADVLPLSASLFASNAVVEPRFHFVNGGAVLDHGQRQRWDGAGEAALASASVPSGSLARDASLRGGVEYGDASPTGSLPPSCVHAAAPILPWFSLLVPQLKTALSYVATGGALMLVHGAPHCASLFILMRCMEDVVGIAPSTPSSARRGRVHVLETMHLAKAPVYVLWTDVRTPRRDPSDGAEAQGMQNAQACLLEALSTTSPRISPLCRTAPLPPSITAAGNRRALLREKQRLWLGESDEGFELAVVGFQRYGHLVEAVWRRMEAFLRQRRERAEREVRNGSSGADCDRKAASVVGLKRMRTDA